MAWLVVGQDMASMVASGLNTQAKLALAILGNSRTPVPKTRLQKQAFLLAKTLGLDEILDASAYYFGPFSENLVDALRGMKDTGVVKAQEDQLTTFGQKVFAKLRESESAWDKVALFAQATEDLPDRELVSMVYDLFPEYTDKSLIRDTATRNRGYEVATADGEEVDLVFSDARVRVKRVA